MSASDKIRQLRQSAAKLEKSGQSKAADWYAKQADKVEAEAEEAQKPRPWGR